MSRISDAKRHVPERFPTPHSERSAMSETVQTTNTPEDGSLASRLTKNRIGKKSSISIMATTLTRPYIHTY